MARLAKSLTDIRPRYDVVIVGSGYGGGVAASRLARAGKRVCVLERGREVVTGEFPSRFPDMRNEMRVTGKRISLGSSTSLYDIRLGDDMHVIVGCGLGGGSLINAGVALRPDRRVFADPVWPGQIAQDGLLDDGFRRAYQWLAPASDPEADAQIKYQALLSAADGMEARARAPEITVSFMDRISAGGIEQPACTRCGDCCAGCNVGAKTTVALTYLPDAARHGAELVTDAKVSHIEKTDDGDWAVHIHEGIANGTPSPPTLQINADIVILAAGTLGSSEILLRSRAYGLSLSERLGKQFSANGDIIAFGYGGTQKVNAIGVGHPIKDGLSPIGASVTGQLEIDDPCDLSRELRVQEGALPSAFAPMLPVLFVPNGRLLGALKSLIVGVYNGPLACLQTFFAVSHDSAAGQLVLEDDILRVTWPGAAGEPVYERLDAILGQLAGNVGASYVRNPLAGTVMGAQPATAHPLGGCAMAADSAHGVVDHQSRVFDTSIGNVPTTIHRGLYVIDGSIIPRSLGVNPLLTITALAERAMLHLAADHGLRFNAEPLSDIVPVAPTEPGRIGALAS